MTIDEFIRKNEPLWIRLDQTWRAHKSKREVVDFVQFANDLDAVQTHLNVVRTHYRDDELIYRLSTLSAQAGRALNRTQPLTFGAIRRWFTETFPAAFWSFRYWILFAFVVFFLSFLGMGLWAIADVEVLNTLMPEGLRKAYVEHDFVNYYSDDEGALFFTKVTTNNIGVAFLTFGSGVLLAVPTLFVLFSNATQLGAAWAAFVEAGDQSTFWLYIAPHGFMELFAIFVAGGIGMALGWTWVVPGNRSRVAAFADVGSRTTTVAMGMAVMLVIAGLIEGFVTGATLPLWMKAGFGFIAWASLVALLCYFGWQSSRKGMTGSLRELQRIEFSTPAKVSLVRYA